jgi:hypothetical protein
MRALAVTAFAVLALGVPSAAWAQNAGGDPPYFPVGSLPPPSVSGVDLANDIAQFSSDFPLRITGGPTEVAAAEILAAEGKALGYQAEIVPLPLAGGDPGVVLRAVVATKRGLTKPDEHILFMGHYDTVATTIQGAYDNASGTNMIRALAKSFAKVPTNRSLVFVWYNGEEEGLLASEQHAAQFKEAGKAVCAVLGFDMVGIAYPVAQPTSVTCLCFWHGDEDERLEGLLRYVNFDVLRFPEQQGLVEFGGIDPRNSDERSWDRQGYPILRWAGMRRADDYPAYHDPDDTMATIVRVAGGRSYFEDGLRNTLLSAWYSTLVLDNELPVARGRTRGRGPVTFDARASADPDGPVSSYQWDFGDGTKGTGATATHRYRRRGTYTVRLTVGDNLWPQVSAAADMRVKVTRVAGRRARRAAKADRVR